MSTRLMHADAFEPNNEPGSHDALSANMDTVQCASQLNSAPSSSGSSAAWIQHWGI